MKRLIFTCILFSTLLTTISAQDSKLSAYLMVYHKDQDHGLHMAVSEDAGKTVSTIFIIS